MTSRATRHLFQAAFIGLACSCAVPAFQTIPGYVQVEAPSPTFASSSTLSSSLSSSLRLFHDTSAFFDGRPSSRLSFLLRLSAEAQEEEEEVEEELKFPPNIISSSTPKPNENNSSEQHDRQKSFQQGGLQLNQRRWVFRDKYPIAYEVATDATPWRRESEHEKESDTDVVPILLLNGFGVGSFHQHRLMRRLLLERRAKNNHRKQNVRYLVYGIDYLGQGQSWPAFCDDGNSPDEFQLSYSADTWIEQLGLFLRDVVLADAANNDGDSPRKAHIVGNSVGGYLAAVLSSLHPHLVSTVALLNATPVWGLNLPFWDGKLPAPFVPRRVGRALFDVIREEGTIDRYLEAAYATRGAYDGTFHDGFGDESSTGDGRGVEGDGGLGKKIRACTEGKGGHAAFASILWSAPASAPDFFSAEGHLQQQQQQQPTMKQQQQQQQQQQEKLHPPQQQQQPEKQTKPQKIQFYQALQSLPMDVLLLFGSDDPWCTPAVAKRMHSTLSSRRNIHDNDDEFDDECANTTPASRYVAIDNCGHCPNHEAPAAVAKVLLAWFDADDNVNGNATFRRNNVELIPNNGESEATKNGHGVMVKEPWGDVWVREVSIEESRKLDFMDWMVANMVG
mmetsp:Transcript_25795/g.51625  ORF Transcript_25795/g.51625 Transcript_25795/m.51625 type:complete len:619 (-) Transcript_25795:112-1968(-)